MHDEEKIEKNTEKNQKVLYDAITILIPPKVKRCEYKKLSRCWMELEWTEMWWKYWGKKCEVKKETKPKNKKINICRKNVSKDGGMYE